MPKQLKMSRGEIMATLRAERLAATQRVVALKREIASRQKEIDSLEVRLRDIDHAEGLLS